MALKVEIGQHHPRRAGARRALVRRPRRQRRGGGRGRQPQPAPALVGPSRGHPVVRGDRLRPRRARRRHRRQPGGQDAARGRRAGRLRPLAAGRHLAGRDRAPRGRRVDRDRRRRQGPGPTEHGVGGVNSYTDFLAGDPDMEGTYGHYDGPFPPFNDERLHHYHFVVYALDVPSLGLEGEFKLDDVRGAIEGHVLDEGELVGTYTLYSGPALAREVDVAASTEVANATRSSIARLDVAQVDHLDRRVHVAQRDRDEPGRDPGARDLDRRRRRSRSGGPRPRACTRCRLAPRPRRAARRPSARGSSRGRSPARSRAGGCRSPSRRPRAHRWRG